MITALVFELDSIQSYLFSSGRLRDVAGASELLDRLTDEEAKDNLLDQVCKAAGIKDKIAFPRRAGGAFYAFSESEDAINNLLSLWTLALQQWAPGVGYSFGKGSGAKHLEAFNEARNIMREDGSRQRQRLPVTAPVAVRSRRTGLAAEAWDKSKGEPVDAATERRKKFANPAFAGFISRYAPQEAGLRWKDWPLDLDKDFPFVGDDRTVALIHADGNGLGQLLLGINKAVESGANFLSLYSAFSRLASDVTKQAAQQATRKVILPAHKNGKKLAARPILLGGDDVTVLVRADLAMDYCRVFAEEFEKTSCQKLKELKSSDIEQLPERLTLGFGVVYLRASQPFFMAIQLAEELMSEAKNAAKARDADNPPSSVMFYRITGSLTDDHDALIEYTMTHKYGDQEFVDTLGTYYFDNAEKPSLADLRKLAALLSSDDMARGPTRQLMTLMGHGKDAAERRYRRWRTVMKDKHPGELREFDRSLHDLAGIRKQSDLPYSDTGGHTRTSPLGDALALVGAGDSLSATSDDDKETEAAA